MKTILWNKDKIILQLKERGIKLNKPVDINTIREFEKTHNIELPLELVEFYTSITNGCVMIDGFKLYSFEEWRFNADRIKKRFPFKKYWIWENGQNDLYDHSDIENGIIELIDIGDAQTWNIVVKGEDHGGMWMICDDGIQPCAPKMTFKEWFVYWLEGNDDFFYGYQCR